MSSGSFKVFFTQDNFISCVKFFKINYSGWDLGFNKVSCLNYVVVNNVQDPHSDLYKRNRPFDFVKRKRKT